MIESQKYKIIFICDRKIISFFEDYINTFHNIFDVEIYLFFDKDSIKSYLDHYINPHIPIFIFMQFIPQNICDHIQFYIDHKYKLCVFNTEQLTRKNYNHIIHSYHRYIYRMDYSEANLFLVSNELNKIYLPYQVHYNEIRNIPKTKDVCMIYPHQSVRRNKIIEELKSKNINVDIISGFLGSRDNKLFQYKVLINVHYDQDYQILEEMRCNRCIMNKMVVISEKSLHDDIYLLRKHIIICDYQEIVDKVINVLHNYDLYYNHLFRSFDKLLSIYDNDLQSIANENIKSIFDQS